jgi:hypothetical protein
VVSLLGAGQFWKYQVDVSREWYQEGSSWLAFLLKYFPHFNLDLCISRPAYDPETGYAIISSLWGSCWGPGGGGIESMTLLIYKDGKITELWKAYEISVQMAMADVEPEVYANMRYVTPSKLLEE